ncbi:hypothetical protein [Streptomyces sp. NPDC006875]|uniref:hypothetical protein n=1 Tax=Streptomyces sp. NPDC006875 TaxID=3154781 RepID=UPI0033E0354C
MALVGEKDSEPAEVHQRDEGEPGQARMRDVHSCVRPRVDRQVRQGIACVSGEGHRMQRRLVDPGHPVDPTGHRIREPSLDHRQAAQFVQVKLAQQRLDLHSLVPGQSADPTGGFSIKWLCDI